MSLSPTQAQGSSQHVNSASETTPLLNNATDASDGSTGDMRPWYRRPSPLHVVLPLVGTVFSYSISLVPIQQFMLMYLCGRYLAVKEGQAGTAALGSLISNDSINDLPSFAKCREIPDVQALAAKWQMILTLSTSVPALLATPLIGALSDRAGRRPVFFLPILSGLIGSLAILAVAQFDFGLWILILVHLLQGCMGGYLAIVMITFAYIADVTSAERRSKVFVTIEALTFISFTLGPYCGGVLTRMLPSGVIGVVYVTIVGQLLTVLYVAFCLPESLTPPKRTVTDPGLSTPPAKPSVLATLLSFAPVVRVLSKPPRTYLLSLVFITSTCVGGIALFFYYASYRFGWDAYDEGVFMLYASGTRVFWMMGIATILYKVFAGERHGESEAETSLRKVRLDVRIVRVGMLVLAAGWIGLGLATDSSMVYAVTFWNGIGTLAKPTIRSLLSRSVPPALQGRLFSTIQVTDQVATIFSNLVFPPIWAASVGGPYPGLFLQVIGGLFCIAAFIACAFIRVGDIANGFHGSIPVGEDAEKSVEELVPDAEAGERDAENAAA
ncbi:hypothetical protein SpCBS45565_g04955 [Spizellomyces sp. 'palustris']|nr:hypothetical protein SpCBS45565_g04955 [Spizellomyces sp. 'palustris']